MLTFFQNKTLTTSTDTQARLAELRTKENALAARIAAGRKTDEERELEETQAEAAMLAEQLVQEEAATVQRDQNDLATRYDAAREELAECLASAFAANDRVREIECEARERFPRGARPAAPAVFFDGSQSWPELGVGGRIVPWLRVLVARPDAAQAILDQRAEADRERLAAAEVKRVADLAQHKISQVLFNARNDPGQASVVLTANLSALTPEARKEFHDDFAALTAEDRGRVCKSCYAGGVIAVGTKRKRQTELGGVTFYSCPQHATETVAA